MERRKYATTFAAASFACCLMLASSCGERRFKEGMKLGGVEVPAETLELGYNTYQMYCIRCHGPNGDGKGASGTGLWPPPRDFTLATFKFTGSNPGELPRDEDLARIIRSGLKGTAMLPWNLPDKELNAVIQYIKTFAADYWAEAVPAEKVAPAEDPWAGRVEEGVQKGREVFHKTALCQSCHPAYAAREELASWGIPVREDAYNSKALDSETYGAKVLPPDFLRHQVRAGTTEQDLYRTIYFGISGTPMAPWSSLSAEEIWALVHYVKSLADMRDTPQARQLRDSLLSSPVPPPPPEPAAAKSDKKK